eukprot:UN11764
MNNVQIAAIIISAVILATIFGLVGFCVFCDVKRKRKMNGVCGSVGSKAVKMNNRINVDGKSYESVEINNVGNVEMQDIQQIQTDDEGDEDEVVFVDESNQQKHPLNTSYHK